MKRKLNYTPRFNLKEKKNSPPQYQKFIVITITLIIAAFIIFFFVKNFIIPPTKTEKLDFDNKAILAELKVLYMQQEYALLEARCDLMLQASLPKKTQKIVLHYKMLMRSLKLDYETCITIIESKQKVFENDEYSLILGFFNLEISRYDKAISLFENIREKSKYKEDAILYMSYAYYKKSEYAKAIAVLEKQTKKSYEILYNLAFLYMLEGKYDKTVGVLSGVSDILIKDFALKNSYLLLLSKSAAMQQNYDYALLQLEKISTKNELSGTYLYNKAYLSFMSKRPAFIDEVYKKALVEDQNPFVYEVLFCTEYIRKNYGRVTNIFLNHGDMLKKNTRYKLMYLESMYKLSEYQKILTFFKTFDYNSVEKEFAAMYFFIHYNTLVKTDNIEEAEVLAHGLVRSMDNNMDYLQALIDYYTVTSNYDAAHKLMTDGELVKKSSPEYYLLASDMFMLGEEYNKAQQMLVNVLSFVNVEYLKPVIYRKLLRNALYVKNIDDFEKFYTLIDDTTKNDHLISAYFFQYAVLKKDWDNVVSILSKKEENNLTTNDRMFYAYSLYMKKDFDESLRHFLFLIEHLKDNILRAKLAVFIGNIYYYKKNNDQALFYYKQAKVYDPDMVIGDFNIKSILRNQ